jgi:hypothetical protein
MDGLPGYRRNRTQGRDIGGIAVRAAARVVVAQ